MSTKLFAAVFVLLLCPGAALAETYRCVGANGSIGFQATPCKSGKQSTKVEGLKRDTKPAKSDFRLVEARIPMGVGTAHVPTLASWNATVEQPRPDLPPTFRITSGDPNDPMTLLITFLPNPQGRQVEAEEYVAIAEQAMQQYVADSVEQEIRLQAIDTTLGTGLYARFNDRKYQGVVAPPGEFPTITTGLIWHSKVIVNFTILSNGANSESLEMAMATVGGFVVQGGSPASP